MKILSYSFLLFFIFPANAVLAQQMEAADWSALFPEVPGCERIIEPLVRDGEIFEQTAIYKRHGFRENKDTDDFTCGSIVLRYEPSARKSASINFSKGLYPPLTGKLKVKTFDAYSTGPLCGNDIWMGTTSIYFDKDKILTVSANIGAANIYEFAENADYDRLKKSIDKFVKSS